MLDPDQRDQVRARIASELQRLEHEIPSLQALTRPVAPDSAIGRLSRLEAINEKSINEAALRSAQALQQRLNAALSRVGDDAFGQCSECGGVIPLPRLLSIPDSRMCVACRERSER